MVSNKKDKLIEMLEGKYFYSKTYETLLAFKGGDIIELEPHTFIKEPHDNTVNVLLREAIKELYNIDSHGSDIGNAVDTYLDIIK